LPKVCDTKNAFARDRVIGGLASNAEDPERFYADQCPDFPRTPGKVITVTDKCCKIFNAILGFSNELCVRGVVDSAYQ
jgi:hypothetical protein